MSKHATDKRAPSDGGRMKHFAEVERIKAPEGSHPATKTLLRRATGAGESNRRAAEFLRIDRGWRA